MNGPGSVFQMDDLELENLRLAAENRVLRTMLHQAVDGGPWHLKAVQKKFQAYLSKHPASPAPGAPPKHLRTGCLCPECRVERAGGG